MKKDEFHKNGEGIRSTQGVGKSDARGWTHLRCYACDLNSCRISRILDLATDLAWRFYTGLCYCNAHAPGAHCHPKAGSSKEGADHRISQKESGFSQEICRPEVGASLGRLFSLASARRPSSCSIFSEMVVNSESYSLSVWASCR